MNNPILDSSNNAIDVTIRGATQTTPVLGGLPLGLFGTELATKVGLVAGGSSGSTNATSGQQTSTGSAASLVAARATRRGVIVKNASTAGSVAVGGSGVTFAAGFLLGPGESAVFTTVSEIFVIDNGSTHCTVTFWDEYD